jgi:hypothetical protein
MVARVKLRVRVIAEDTELVFLTETVAVTESDCVCDSESALLLERVHVFESVNVSDLLRPSETDGVSELRERDDVAVGTPTASLTSSEAITDNAIRTKIILVD